MSRVKFDYIVSCSSEDPEHKADNLLNWEVSKKRWLCAKWEPSCSVVIQLKRMVQISAVQIGAYHSALVEVLVGLSEKPNEQFQVLIPRSVFVGPRESRGEGVERVRAFTRDALCDVTRDLRWDRLRIVCSQPYNKQCQYGLYFVHVDCVVEETATAAASDAARLPAGLRGLARGLDDDHDDDHDDEFAPGELFRAHRAAHPPPPATPTADVQSSQTFPRAAKNITDSSSKLVKTPITKNHNKTQFPTDLDPKKNRQSDNLMYDEDDDRPHNKIDRVMKRHKDDKSKEDDIKTKHQQNKVIPVVKNDKKHADKLNSSRSKFEEFIDDTKKKDDMKKIYENKKRRSNHNTKSDNDIPSGSNKATSITRIKTDTQTKVPDGGVLSGVVFALSGYENPRRATLRDLALRLGARYTTDVAAVTHLICAFPNTPKLRSVRAGGGAGAACAAVTGEWVEACARAGARRSEEQFAVERRRRAPPPPPPPPPPPRHPPPHHDDECDTDDEIEKVLRKQKKRKLDNERVVSPEKTPSDVRKDASDQKLQDASSDSDVAFVVDERIQGNVTVESDSEDTDTQETRTEGQVAQVAAEATLPDVFAGARFLLRVRHDAGELRRYIAAYGGCVLRDHELLEERVDYIVCEEAGAAAGAGAGAGAAAGAGRGERVRPAWVWACHARRSLCDPAPYLLH